VLEEQALDSKIHDRDNFSCGVQELDNYLKHFAIQHTKKGITTVRVLIDSKSPKTILGYYALSAAQVDAHELNPRIQKNLPKYPIPCFRLGRLATHIKYRDQGFGKNLIGLAVTRCLEAKKHICAYALIVDAKNTKAKKFYEHFGFTACNSNPLTLYLPLGK
jgi:ribosomal protein S18 acetylase RimI-like enzyme